ncbi:MAG TPA: hypothetical protein VIC61_01720, partial [Gammaproteobacteria bacterium]
LGVHMKRREFLYFTAGASALSVAGIPLPALAGMPSVSIHRAIYDARYLESVDFVREAEVLGIPVSAIEGDVTRLWYNDLSLRWRERPQATAGLTEADALFCFEQLARDYRMRVVYREARGELVSWVIAPMSTAH